MVLAFDSAKTVPLIKFEATLLQGLRFLTLPRFCVLIVWGSTSAVSFQHLRFMFTQMNYISDQDSKLELQVKMFVGKLCLVIILVVIMIVFMVVMQPGFIKECRKKFLEEDSHETKGMLLVCYCIALGYFLVWKDDTQVIWTMLLGFVGAVIMAWFNPSQEQSWVPILWRRQVVDFVFIFLVEVVPLVSGIWGCFFWGHTSDGRGPLGAFWRSYVWGAVFSVMIATATFQTCNVYIAGKVILSEITAKTEAGILQRPFRHRAEFEVQRKLEAMFHRDRVPPGILAQVPESLFQSAVKEVEQSALSFPAYAKHQELSDNGVPVWKYFWYLAFACILGATLFVVQGLDSSNGEQSFNTMIRTALVCSQFFIILFGFKYFPIHARKCLKRLCFQKTGYLDLDNFVKHQTDVWSPLIVVFVLYIVLVFASFFGEFYGMDAKAWIPGVCPCFLLVAAFASLAVEKKAPPLINSSYWKLIWLFALVITVIMIIPIFQLPHAGASVPIVGKIDTAYDRKTRAEDYRYDLCNWIHGPASLTALDMATFAGLTYETDNEQIKQKLSIVFSGRDLNMTGSLPEEYPRYVVFDIGTEEKTRVIAIKGTSTPKDIYMDIALFAVIEILQFLEFVFPIIDLFPTDQIQWLLYRAHLFSQREVEKDFWDTTTANISSRWVTNQSTSNTILTGHSLGGLMAQVIAARLNLPAFVFSSPGVKYSATRFGIHDAHYWMKYTPGERPGAGEFGVEVLKAKVRNVIPDEDLVPRVDKQIGIVDRIECRDGLTKTDAKENERPMTFQCHMLTRTSCELWRACGDIYKRKFNCGAYHYGPKDIGEWETPDDNE